MDRHSGGGGPPPHLRGRPVSGLEAAHANEYFEPFLNATTLKNILGYHRSMCEFLHLKPNVFTHFYPKLRANLTSWRAKALWKKFDARASHKCYAKGKSCAGTRVLVIGGGPCGLRTAIEAQLLGAKVVVIEKRDRLSRNNVLHLWPFVIEDLRMLGAKKFFGKFCAGAIDHISIRQLQCVLLKVALLLGVELHTEVSFEQVLEPSSLEKTGWRAKVQPDNHPVSQYEFDVIIGADGKRNTLQGFKRKEFRGKLAIAITANFINKKSEAEARVEEISGVAFIFNQKFFKDLQKETRIDLENIVYYKDDTHYFVMTAKKASLLEKGVIKQDLSDTEKLLAPENVDRDALQNYARQAADFSTNYQLPELEFAVNHYGQPDVAMFDFTSMYAAEYASKVVERHGCRLLMMLVGDSLLEPFWPTGSGCARGFLSSLDAAWAIRSYCSGQMTPLDVLAERESIYRLLAQTTPDNLNKDWKAYTLDPATRYPNLNKSVVTPHQTVCLYDTDNVSSIEKMKRASLEAAARLDHVPKKRRRGNVDNAVLLGWLSEQLRDHPDIRISDVNSIFRDGKVLCAIVHHYRPDLLDYKGAIKDNDAAKCNQLAMDILERDLGILPFMTGEEITNTEDYLAMATYLTQVYDTFRGEIPHIKHPKLKISSSKIKHQKISNKDIEIIEKPKNNLSQDTFLTSSIRSFESSKKEQKLNKPRYFDVTFNCEQQIYTCTHVIRENETRKKRQNDTDGNKIKSRSVAVSVNTTAKKRKPKIKLPIIDEEQKSLNCDTLEPCSSKKSSTRKSSIIHKQIISPRRKLMPPFINLSILDTIRKHLLLKKRQLGLALSHQKIATKSQYSQTDNLVITKKFYTSLSKNGSVYTSSTCSNKKVEQIYENKENFIKSSQRCTHTSWLKDQKNSKKRVNFRISPIETNQSLFNKPAKFSRTELVEEIFESKRTLDRLKWSQNVVFQRRTLSDSEKKSKRKSQLQAPIEKPPTLTRSDLQIIKLLGSTFLQKLRHSKRFRDYSSKLGKSLGKGGQRKMEHIENDVDYYKRVRRWLSREKFEENRKKIIEIGTQHDSRPRNKSQEVKAEANISASTSSTQDNIKTLLENLTNEEKFKKHMLRVSKSRMKHRQSVSVPPTRSVILEGEEFPAELPENKNHAFPFKSIKTTSNHQISSNIVQPRPSSRHKRHADILIPPKSTTSVDKKQRKRRTMERVAPTIEERQKTLEEISNNRLDRQNKRKQQRQRQTEQFLKSMQMLHANCKPDRSEPFEDYSIFLYRQTAPKFKDRVKDLEKQFTYVPDHDTRLTGLKPLQNTNAEEDIASKIKSLEDKWSNQKQTEKKPKDLMRAIGKIETSDWNIQQIEKKILENKIGKPSTLNADKERVPRWSKEEFRARQTKMEKKHLDEQENTETKYADIDRNIKQLELKLKEGTNRELGQNKVATITERLVSKVPQDKEKLVTEKPKAVNLPIQSGSEFCHFCNKRVYLMERLSAESRFFHHGCFKCQYCHSQLRLGSYMFDHDGQYGFKFFCMHHYGMQGELPRPTKVTRKPSQKREGGRSPHKKHLTGVKGLDLLDRVQTPERIEFSNLSTTGNISSDHEEPLSQMDEDEWTDKNFGASCNELDESDDDESSISDTDSDDEDAFDDALEQPITKEGTMKWAERWKNSYRKGRRSDSDGYSSSDHSSYYENSSDDSDSDTATEGEEEIRARELRKQEVRVKPPIVQTDTGTDTEMVSEESSSSSEIQNSATEISTDSEFAQDDPTPTRELPSIALNDFHVTKTRGSGGNSNHPKRIQVTSGYIQKQPNIELKLSPLVPTTTPSNLRLFKSTNEGYALNRTQSTGGIAAKVSLELKKKYLLGESGTNSIQKSGSASTLDTKFKSFQNTISDCQKLLKPAPEVSASMQMFCSKLDERHSPVVSPPTTKPPPPDITITTISENKDVIDQDNEEARPRSPIHEASIAVPSIDWSKNKSQSSDSLSLTSQSENEASFHIPRVEVHEAKEEEEMALDSLCVEAQKTITSEKKILNQPKSLPNLHNDIHKALHVRVKEDSPGEASGKSSPEVTTALTETELSDWARDENASDSIDMDMSQDSGKKKPVKIASIEEHVCGKTILTEALNNALSGNLDHIEYMDTGSETSSDDGIVDSQNGYVLLKSEEEIFEAKNVYLHKKEQENTGYCEIVNNFGGKVIDLKPQDLEKLKQKQTLTDHEEDSLVIIDTTTEENTTCSDSTVKNVTELHPAIKIENLQKQRLEEKLAKVKAELKNDKENSQYEEHCQRLQSKVEFGNARDSIDIRKSRRKSKSDPPPQQKPDLIQEEEPIPTKDITLNLAPVRPDVLYKKENIKKERDVNKKLIEEMVMNKMKAENKSLERKKRSRTNLGNLSPYSSPSPKNSTPDLLSNTTRPLSVFSAIKLPETPLTNPENFSMPDIRKNLFANDDFKTPKAPPRYNRPSDVTKTAEKMKESARARARLLSNEDLGLSPEDKINRLREKFNNKKDVQESIEALVLNTEKRNSLLYSNDTLTKKRNGSFKRSKSGDSDVNNLKLTSVRPKSISEIPKNLSVSKTKNRQEDGNKKICKSDPNLLNTNDKKKSKDGERRKSITKLIAGIFTKKSPTGGGLFAKLSPKSKATSKSLTSLDFSKHEPKPPRKSQSEINIKPPQEPTPPPIPPLPINYSIKDESSDGELQQRSSCDTLDQSAAGGSKKTGKARRVSRQAQLKRHRMAQEIQRKLEETEVKTRELEQRGVEVEKALRGEDDSGSCLKDEGELLQEWFDLMRDRTELRRYEKELMVRAEELELEDRHARLQVDLRERLESNENKTEADLKIEESIINEMMDIVAKRDTLIAVLEEDRLKYSHEDKDLEEQMLSKGLMLTPIKKTIEK